MVPLYQCPSSTTKPAMRVSQLIHWEDKTENSKTQFLMESNEVKKTMHLSTSNLF